MHRVHLSMGRYVRLVNVWQAVGGVVQKLDEIRSSIGKKLDADVVDATLQALTTSYTSLWDEVGPEARAVRQQLAPQVRSILLEASNALRRLSGHGDGPVGGGGGGGAEEEDEDLVDVTEVSNLNDRRPTCPCAYTSDNGPCTHLRHATSAPARS